MSGPAPFLPVTPLIVAHVVAGLAALVAGALAMLAAKGSMPHRWAGLAYLFALAALVLTGSILAFAEWASRRHLFVLGTVALGLGAAGYLERWRRHHGWRSRHLLAMGASYVVMLTAFYVDNGPRLPLWWRLPEWALWLLPSLVGTPLIARAWRRHRVETP